MYSNKLINERIRKLIGKEAMNVVSRKLGFSQFVLSEHFKNNERDWSLYLLDKICTHYKVSLDWLVFGEGDCAEQIKENLLLKDKIRSLEEAGEMFKENMIKMLEGGKKKVKPRS